MMVKHIFPVQIRFNDIDILGHVNNAVYQEYFDRARLDYFLKCFKRAIDWASAGFVIASIQIDFANPIFLEDQIYIETSVKSVCEKSLAMFQLVKKKGLDEPAAIGKTVMVSFDYSKKESMEMPAEWINMLEAFEGKQLV